jgi:Zn-dependent protease
LFSVDTLQVAASWVLPILFAITLHEAAHAFAAWRLGDETAYRLGRVSLDPLRHVDPFGTVLLPALLVFSNAPFLIGWAKPVPVAFAKLRHPRRGIVLVALAGPATNIVLALVSALLFHLLWLLPDAAVPWAARVLHQSILLNLVLALFNMLPIPPLDGGRVAVGLLPDVLARPLARLERYGLLVLLAIIFLLPLLGQQIGVNLNVLRWAVGLPLQWMLPFFRALAGVS